MGRRRLEGVLSCCSGGGIRQADAEGGNDGVGGDFADAVIVVAVAGFAKIGRGAIAAGKRGLEQLMAFADRAPGGDFLRAVECGDGRADGGGEVHGTAVVAEEAVDAGEESGELSEREALFQDDGGRGHFCRDGIDDGLLGGAGDKEDAGAIFGLEGIADRGE